MDNFSFIKCPCCYGGEHFRDNLQICKQEDFFICLECGVMGDTNKLILLESKAPLQNFKANQAAQQVFLKQKSDKFYSYINHRGLNEERIKRFCLSYASNDKNLLSLAKENKMLFELFENNHLINARNPDNVYETFRGRLMFPIKNHIGLIAGFGGRTLNDEATPKYLNSQQSATFNKSEILYGLYENKPYIQEKDEAYVFEGYMDVVSCASKGVNNCVATMGIAISKKQLFNLSRVTNNATFIYDGDTAGRKAMRSALMSVIAHHPSPASTCYSFLPEGVDPDDLVKTSPGLFLHTVDKNKITFHEFLSIIFEENLASGISNEETNTLLEKELKKNQYIKAKANLISILCDREYKDRKHNITIENDDNNELIHRIGG
ncbi:hypothetical protein PULV_a3897 [Pseudoalteromonas ulvae UL12]|uniref:DNA primase n=1 Tax=Pseudoalteromonas ulvae TaxID=107327 RepID=UPI00186B68A3|nr:DNA primase [Pseudoalteromonas ulvae]MBE0362101.1 hypothetical protein [Pseudoalteromonas ulvae UL12]